MKTTRLISTMLLAGLLCAGCAEVRPARLVGRTMMAAGGALGGHALGKGKPLFTAAGAGAGALAGEALFAGVDAAERGVFEEGFEAGRADAARRNYRALLEQQREGAVGELPSGMGSGAGGRAARTLATSDVGLMELPLPERRVNGVTFAPAKVTLRVAE